MKRARSQQDKQARRTKLLDAALDRFFEKRFAAARMEDIARAAGVSKGTAYLYFSSKENMFHAIIEAIALPRVSLIRQALESAPSATQALTSLLLVGANLAQYSPMPKIVKILISEGNQFPHLLEEYRTRVIDQLLAALTRLLEKAHASGELHAPQPELTAKLVIAPIIFSAIWQITFARLDDSESGLQAANKTSLDIKMFLTLHTELLLKALTPRPPNGDSSP
jgi:AcrR family transcriptional regulator